MIQTYKKFINVDFILLLLYLITASVDAASTALCPAGFKISHSGTEPICYRLKGKETFADKFENCPGNRFTLQLYQSLNLPQPEGSIWTPYKTAYEGGPFVDWSYTDSTGELLQSTYKVRRDSRYSVNEELCVVMDPVVNFTAVRCDERHYSYCLVDPYSDDDCDEFSDPSGNSRSLRFYSPVSTCLMRLVAVSKIRATWKQSQKMCVDRGGSLLHHGWIYLNHHLFSNYVGIKKKSDYPIYPLGITFDENFTVLRYDHDGAQIPESEWNFGGGIDKSSSEMTLGAVQYNETTWQLVNRTHIFYDVVCEKTVPLVYANLTLFIKSDKIILSVNDTDLRKEDILCFTDSDSFYPQKIDLHNDRSPFVLKPKHDGYYWCTHRERTSQSEHKRIFHASQSNKILHIKVKQETLNVYAVKLTHSHDYSLDYIDVLVKYAWRDKLEEYVYGTNKNIINRYRETFREISKSDVVQDVVLKRVYLNSRTALLHVKLHPDMRPVTPGSWKEIRVEYMKPVYYCEALDGLPRLPMGETRWVSECEIYKCVGNFNEGVQLQLTAETTCPRNKTLQEQLQQVIDELDLLLNTTDAIMVADINPAFDQVDIFLGEQEELDIPGELLHLLDKIGSRVDLNGSHEASAVRGNVALMAADAAADSPVRGLRIANRPSDTFTDDAFQIIREELNSSILMSESSEVVVQLPASVTASSRRISFVVFRNDRAFQSGHGLVNSRILSVNIENTTEFQNGEVIDIHLTPLESDPDRNQSRSCAYWHFNPNGSGYWSEEGCTFIRATTAGTLDMCRCDHLTHFAEVLIPRTVFSERNENALEIVSIVGCCLSISGLMLVGVTALLFRSWRRDYNNKIWLQLCISIFMLSLSFLIIVFARFEVYDVVCMLSGILLHYSTLSSFCWMLVAAVLSYRRLVKVFARDASHKLLRAGAFAWGSPCALIGVLLSVEPHAYSGRFDEAHPTASFCYPSGLALWVSVYAPVAAMLLANWTLFALIVRSVFASKRIQRHGADTNEALRCASVSFFLVFLFGLPWVFGLFAMNIVMAYMYAILSTFQGFVLFLFFVLGNKNTRDLWLNKLRIKQTRKIPVTSSTYTNRSTGGNVSSRAGNQSVSIEAKVSKPRSLASSDDSRFS